MIKLVATPQVVVDPDEESYRLGDWDAIVSNNFQLRNYAFESDHFFVLAFGSAIPARYGQSTRKRAMGSFIPAQPSAIMKVSDDLPDALTVLVRDDLVPWLRSQSLKPCLTATTYWSLSGESTPPNHCVLVWDADGNALAGDLARGGEVPNDEGRIWAIPFLPDHPERWLRAALNDWHTRAPERFPRSAHWSTRATWQTPAEVSTGAAIAAVTKDHAAAEAEFTAKLAGLEDAAEKASVSAAKTSRRLLTDQGEELVEAVKHVLATLGFIVRDMDELNPVGKARKEDLRISDPEGPAWTNITEMKGYLSGGAKSSDITKMARYSGLYMNETGAEPSSQWYIVNHFGSRDPDDRPRVLAGADDDIEYFASYGGLIVDTRELFKLLNQVQTGSLATPAARRSLVTATGIYAAPALPDAPATNI